MTYQFFIVIFVVLTCNFNKLLVYLNTISQSFDFIILTETWLSVDLNFNINGYKTYHSLGFLNKSDDVTIFIRKNVFITDLNTHSITDCNSIGINFKFNLNNYKISGIYRSPSFAINNFLMGIDSYLSNISNNFKVIICGDMNINILEKSSDVSNYLNILASYNFISCIDSYTRVTDNTKSCIDHIFIRNVDLSKANSFVIKTDITDHFSLAFYIKEDFIDNLNDNLNNNNFYSKKITNFNILNTLISFFDWQSLLISNDVDILVDKFNYKIKELITSATNVATISKSKIKKTHKIKIWITNGLLISIKNRQKLYNKKNKSPFD